TWQSRRRSFRRHRRRRAASETQLDVGRGRHRPSSIIAALARLSAGLAHVGGKTCTVFTSSESQQTRCHTHIVIVANMSVTSVAKDGIRTASSDAPGVRLHQQWQSASARLWSRLAVFHHPHGASVRWIAGPFAMQVIMAWATKTHAAISGEAQIDWPRRAVPAPNDSEAGLPRDAISGPSNDWRGRDGMIPPPARVAPDKERFR
ncbi:hypothetical protein QBC47DRAFT_435270, partial [Echria macrotheca]